MFRFFLLFLSVGPILAFGEQQREQKFFFIKPWIPINIPIPRPRPAGPATPAACPTIVGCTTAQCAGMQMCPVGVAPTDRMNCYWPAGPAPATCTKDLTTTMDCGCNN